jgi:iron complex outermembrane receptor protein
LYRTESGAAPRAASLMLAHSPSPGWDISAAYNYSDGATLMSSNEGSSYTLQRTDVRVARALRLGKRKAEIAISVQNLGPASLNSDRKFYFDQRALVTLRIAE